MAAFAWLRETVPGFADLTALERQAIFDFTLLWSLFEARALSTNASAPQIIAAVDVAHRLGRLDMRPFEPHLDYFCSRYFADGVPTDHFQHLHLRDGDSPALVRRVLARGEANPSERVSSLLIVIYRFRNNLFHGRKWAYELRDQADNFIHSTEALIVAYGQMARHDT